MSTSYTPLREGWYWGLVLSLKNWTWANVSFCLASHCSASLSAPASWAWLNFRWRQAMWETIIATWLFWELDGWDKRDKLVWCGNCFVQQKFGLMKAFMDFKMPDGTHRQMECLVFAVGAAVRPPKYRGQVEMVLSFALHQDIHWQLVTSRDRRGVLTQGQN